MSDQPVRSVPSTPGKENSNETSTRGQENSIESKNPSQPVRGNWGEQKTKLKEQFPTLTDADLRYENGRKDEMLTNVQEKLGKTKEEFDKIINEL